MDNLSSTDRELLTFTRDELRRFYCERKEDFTKQKLWLSRSTTQNLPFEKAAKICIALDATPEDFVCAQFRKIGPENMQPAMLHNANAEKYYKDYMSLTRMSLPEVYNTQMLYLETQIRQAKRTVEAALMDDDIKFHPWFRICITKEPIDKVIDKYIAEAQELFNNQLKQFLISKNLDYKRITNE